MKHIVVCCMMFCFSLGAAGFDYSETVTNALLACSSDELEIRHSVTNDLNEEIRRSTNGAEIAVCKLLFSKLKLECADVVGSPFFDPNAYADVTGNCWNVINDRSLSCANWMPYAASLLLPIALSMDNRYADMAYVSTNALAKLRCAGSVEFDTNIWHSIFGTLPLNDDIVAAFNVVAATSLLRLDKSFDVYSYTNELPEEAVNVILESVLVD